MKRLSLALVALLTVVAVASVSAAYSLTWNNRADMTTPRTTVGVVTGPDGLIYTIGGEIAAAYSDAVEAFNPATNSWSTRADLPVAGRPAVAAATNGKLYAISGNQDNHGVFEYDAGNDAWTTKTPIPTARAFLGAAGAPNGKVYAIGGVTDPGSPYTCIATVEEFDPLNNSWAAKTDMPTARCSLAVATAPNGKIYAVGGTSASGNPVAFDVTEEYDPANNSWSTKAPMPTARFGLTLVAAGNGKLYAIGGNDLTGANPGGGLLTTVEEYDPGTNVWTTQTDINVARTALGSAATGGKIYAIGGQNEGGILATNEEASTPSTAVPAACAGMTFDKTIYGTDGADTINGSGLRELIFGFGGNDSISGGAGNDCIVGGDGNDTLSGGSGNDKLLGEIGNDTLKGDSGTDSAIGGANTDACDAESETSCES